MTQQSEVVEVYMRGSEEPRLVASFPSGAQVGLVACHECSGSGWWGYGPTEEECGPCVDCKGTGREWVGLA